MGRASAAKDRLIAAACDLMRNRGYGAIGVAEICAQADVRKGSFYHFFASKQALTIEVIDAHWQGQREAWAATLGADAPALTRLERLFVLQAEGQAKTKESSGAVDGCMLANLALELSGQDEVVRKHLEQVFDEQIDLVRSALEDATAEGAIPAGAAGRATARALVAQLEGMVLFAKLADDPRVLDDLWAQARMLLGASEDDSVTTGG